MKHLLLTTIAAVVLVGCGESQQSAPSPETQSAEPITKEPTEPSSLTVTVPVESILQSATSNLDPNSTIHNAAKAGNFEAVKEHLAAGVDVNEDAGFGMSPLQNAAAFGHSKVVELLIANGADVNMQNLMDLTALDQAEMLNFTNTIDLLREHGGKTKKELKAAGKPTEPVAEAAQPEPPTAKAPDISFHGAAMMGMIELVKQHIASGADVNAKDDGGATPLHRAALNGRKETVELLTANGAEVNAKDNLGWTPLDQAIAFEQPEIADLLRKHGAKTSAGLKAEGK